MVYYLKLVKHLLFNSSVKICWIHGRGEQTINYPISYTRIPSTVACSTAGYGAAAWTGCYNTTLTQVSIKTITHDSQHWHESWALLVIGI